MAHCMAQPHHTSSDTLSLVDAGNHQHHQTAMAKLDITSADGLNAEGVTLIAAAASADTADTPCEACGYCCSIHCAPVPALLAAIAAESHEKVLQHSWFHTSSIIFPQERPPKLV